MSEKPVWLFENIKLLLIFLYVLLKNWCKCVYEWETLSSNTFHAIKSLYCRKFMTWTRNPCECKKVDQLLQIRVQPHWPRATPITIMEVILHTNNVIEWICYRVGVGVGQCDGILTVWWFNDTGCLLDQDRDMDKWVVWFYVEHITLHLNKDRGWWLIHTARDLDRDRKTMDFYIMLRVVHTAQGQVQPQAQGIIVFYCTHPIPCPCPGPVQCV